MTTNQEVKDGYTSTLQDLTCNSKPLISVLTMLAEENVANAKDIVAAIEEHLAKVRTDVKLPVLYLVDCIIKNVGGPYTTAFCNNIVNLFCSVFQVVDEKTRTEMYKLRQTWNEVIPKSKLYALDVKTSQMDPAWPITAAPPNIHFNPKFFNSTNAKIAAAKEAAKVKAPPVARANPSALPESTLDMQQKFIIKQKQLLELQQKKLELDLLQTQLQLKKSNAKNVPATNVEEHTKQNSKLLLKPEVAKQLLSDKKDESAKAMIAQLHQKFPIASTQPATRDPRLLRQQQQQLQQVQMLPTQPSNVQLENTNATGVDNKVVSLNKSGRFVDNKDAPITTSPQSKKLSRIPLKSKRGSSPTNKAKAKLSGSGSSSSLDSPKKAAPRSASKSPTKPASKYKGKSRTANNVEKRGKRRSPGRDSKGRNYRRHRDPSLDVDGKKDVDLRVGAPPEKLPRITDDKHDKDVDLRKLSAGNKKRLTTDSSEAPHTKKNKAEIFDALFGSEDVDLRKLPSADVERPITPPAPIISDKSTAGKKENGSQEVAPAPETAPKLSLDVLRAKLANATNANKDKLQKSRLQLQAVQKKQQLTASKDKDVPEDNKIFITSADEENIKSGKMTKAQESTLMGKIIAQIENKKIQEAKRKENEENLNSLMTQTISDDEFEIDDGVAAKADVVAAAPGPGPAVKQTRFDAAHYPPQGWKGKRGGFLGAPIRPMRGRADPWMRPIQAPPVWKQPPGLDDVGAAADCIELNNSPPPPLMQHDDICMSRENIKSINIDGEPRDILFYGETAIAFMSPDDPREISFQTGQRRVRFDDMNSFVLIFNDPYRDVIINGHCHRIRLGAPTRELYMDGKPFEAIFGGPPIAVEMDRKLVMVHIDGPPPQVKIGASRRTDLVVGKVNLIIDAKTIVSIYLDARTQTFEVDGAVNTLRFKDALKTVLINDQPYNLEFGGLPKGVLVNGRKHFIRFSVLPKGVRRGAVHIADMEGFKPPLVSDGELSQDGLDANSGNEKALPAHQQQQHAAPRPRKTRFSDAETDRHSPNNILNLLQQPSFGNLDSLLSIASSTMPPRNTCSYQIEQPTCIPPLAEAIVAQPMNSSMHAQPPPPVLNPLNINDLFQKLVATGMVTTMQNAQVPPDMPAKHEELVVPKAQHRPEVHFRAPSFDDPASLKVRQAGLIQMFYAGMQCSSCGMRFAQENSTLYSQHLDWHFRQNRKGKKNIRKASSRRWYYSIADWSNYEEIEDLDEREKSYFETQDHQNEGQNEDNEGEIEIPSVPTDANVQDARCEVCEEKFEQFYNEEKEEWHLKMAMRVDERTYHPLCYEDYQASLVNVTMDESIDQGNSELKEEPTTIPGFDIEQTPVVIDFDSADSKSNSPKTEDLTETPCLPEDETKTEVANAEQPEPMETDDDDVVINEVEPVRIVLDDYEMDEHGLIAGVVVKQEPVDDGFTDVENFRLSHQVPTPDESFVDIGHVIDPETEVPTSGPEAVDESAPLANDEEAPIAAGNEARESVDAPAGNSGMTVSIGPNSKEAFEGMPAPAVTAPMATIDGNLDCNAGAAVPTGGIGGIGISGRIKINISKPLPVIAPKENKDISSDVDNNIEPIDPTQPLPPGEEPVQLHLKPALQGIDLKQLPPVNKGSELTGLCSIM